MLADLEHAAARTTSAFQRGIAGSQVRHDIAEISVGGVDDLLAHGNLLMNQSFDRTTGMAVATASAQGEPDFETAEEVAEEFDEDEVPVVLDGGRCAGLPATVVDDVSFSIERMLTVSAWICWCCRSAIIWSARWVNFAFHQSDYQWFQNFHHCVFHRF